MTALELKHDLLELIAHIIDIDVENFLYILWQ